MKKKSWIGTIALSIIIGLFIGGIMMVPRVSAATKAVSNDSLDPDDAKVIELNLTLQGTEPVATSPTTIVKPDKIVPDETGKPMEPATTTQETVEKAPETEEKKEETQKTQNTNNTCDHLWKSEYTPQTETSEGNLRNDCLKCGESYVVETYPPLGEN